ncbi:MAG: membrane protein insertase YidC [Candidatus Homeothermus sp.]|nr:membrane protein insertase YidC [Candidatus Homeothermus sp.]PWL63055.1 MAG: membrane protein insertase YidC [Bacteroidales bacterium]
MQLSSDGRNIQGYVKVDSTDININYLITPELSSIQPLSPQVMGRAAAAVKARLRDLSQYRGFARYLQGTDTSVKLENDLIAVDLSTKGGMIARAELKKYDSYRGGNVVVCNKDNDNYSFILNSTDREFDTRDFYFTPVQESDSTVLMSLDLGGGASFGLRYTLAPDSYVVKLDVVQKGMESVIPSSVVTMDFLWHQKMIRQEKGRMFEERNSAIYYKYAGGSVENLSEAKNDDEEVNERIKWIGFKNQFFSMAFVAKTHFNRADLKSQVLDKLNPEYLKEMDAVASVDYSAANSNPASFDILVVPNLYPLLSDLSDDLQPGDDLNLTRLIPLGWTLFRWINTWIVIPVFEILGKWFTNYGIIILLLTIFIKIIIFPFTYKSYMSQAKMRLLNPEIQAINEKYPGQENAMTRQQKTMELYSRAGANPMAGCLPMLLQMPVLIAMFTFFPSCIELRGESFLWAKDLSAPDAIISWTANIPLVTEYFGNHISLFCLLMTATNIIYTKITMASQASSNAMPGMKWMMYLMPLMFLVFFNNYAAGLSYYYFLSLLITIIQTYVFRHVVSEEKMRAKMAEAAKKPRKKSGFMARLEEAQRQQQAALREQQKRQKGNRR